MTTTSERDFKDVEPAARRRYYLRLSRYHQMAEAVAAHVERVTTPEQRAAGQPCVRLLDFGLDKGRSLAWLRNAGVEPLLELHGTDLKDYHLADCHEPERWQLLLADGEHGVPYRDATFDVVLCEQVLEHLHHPEVAVAEFARILKPGGILIAGVPGLLPGIAWYRLAVIPHIDKLTGKRRDHVQAFTVWSFRRLIRRAGAFTIERCYGPRFASGGILRPLEDRRWYWRFNLAMGRLMTWASADLQLVARRD